MANGMFIYYFYDEVKKCNCGSFNHHKALKMAAGRIVKQIDPWKFEGWFYCFEYF